MPRVLGAPIRFLAATCEIGAEAMLRSGLRGHGWLRVALGVATLGARGAIINLLPREPRSAPQRA